MAFVIWLGTPIVFDIAEEVPPPPSRAGGISSGIVSLDSLGQNLNSHPFSPPELSQIPLQVPFSHSSPRSHGTLDVLESRGTNLAGTSRLASAPAGAREHRTMVLRRRKDERSTPSPRAGMGVARSVRMKHAHTISALPNLPHTERGEGEKEIRVRSGRNRNQCVCAETWTVRKGA